HSRRSRMSTRASPTSKKLEMLRAMIRSWRSRSAASAVVRAVVSATRHLRNSTERPGLGHVQLQRRGLGMLPVLFPNPLPLHSLELVHPSLRLSVSPALAAATPNLLSPCLWLDPERWPDPRRGRHARG